jgi:hypothetical protein
MVKDLLTAAAVYVAALGAAQLFVPRQFGVDAVEAPEGRRAVLLANLVGCGVILVVVHLAFTVGFAAVGARSAGPGDLIRPSGIGPHAPTCREWAHVLRPSGYRRTDVAAPGRRHAPPRRRGRTEPCLT